MLRMLPVESSAVKAVGYEDGSLFVEYKAGGVYEYEDVPTDVFMKLITADSVGSFIACCVKTYYNYRYRRN